MAEARRFLRYLLPGLVFFFYIFIAAYSADLHNRWRFLRSLIEFVISKDNEFASVVFGIFATSLMGFFLSMAHHFFHNFCKHYGTNHIDFMARIKEENLVRFCLDNHVLLRFNSEPYIIVDEVRFTLLGAWRTFMAIWFTLHEMESVKSAHQRSEQMADLYHSFGAMLIGSIISLFAYIAALAIYGTDTHYFEISYNYKIWLSYFAIYIIIFFVHVVSYFTLRSVHTGFIQLVLWNALVNRKQKLHTPLNFVVRESETKCWLKKVLVKVGILT